VKLTKKPDSIQKKEDSPQILNVKIVENGTNGSTKSELKVNERESSPAYSLGQMAGRIGFFILGLLKSKRAYNTNEAINRGKSASQGRRNRKRRG
jgi:hypothetical protein